jgi:hypothetical protein
MTVRPARVLAAACAVVAFGAAVPAHAAPRTTDLAVALQTSAEHPNTHDTTLFSFTVTNAGPSAATAAVLTVTSRLSMFAEQPYGSVCESATTSAGYTWTCPLGDLAPGASTLVQFLAGPREERQETVSGTVTSQTRDTNSANDSASLTFDVLAYDVLPAHCSTRETGCSTSFTLTAPTTVRLHVLPSAAFSGEATARIVSAGTSTEAARASGVYVDGGAVNGGDDALVTLPAGNWTVSLASTVPTVALGGKEICIAWTTPCSASILPHPTVPSAVPATNGPLGVTVSAA